MTWILPDPGSTYYYSAVILYSACIIELIIGFIGIMNYRRKKHYYFLGHALLRRRRLNNAIESFEMYKAIEPEDKETDKILCGLYLETKSATANAVTLFRQVLEKDPFDKEVCNALAVAYANLNRMDEEAEQVYHRALQFHPDHQVFLLMLGKINERSNHTTAAQDFYERSIELGCQDIQAFQFLCNMYYVEGNFTDNIKPFAETFARLNPSETMPHVLLGRIFIEKQDLQKAEVEALTALSLNENNFESLLLMGDVHKTKNNLQSAIHHYLKALHIKPDDLKTLKQLSECYVCLNRMDDQALSVYLRVQDEMDITPEIHSILFNHYMNQRDYGRALKQLFMLAKREKQRLKEAIQQFQNILNKHESGMAYAYYGSLLVDESSFSAAFRALQKACQLNNADIQFIIECYEHLKRLSPELQEVYVELANLYKRTGNLKQGVFILHEASGMFPGDANIQSMLESFCKDYLETNKTDEEIHFVLASMLKNQQRYDEAISEYQLCTDSPLKAKALLGIGQCFMSKDLPELASEYIEKALAVLKPETVRIDPSTEGEEETLSCLYYLGLACEKLNQNEKAIQCYGKIMEFSQGYLDTDQRLDKLMRGLTIGSVLTQEIGGESEIFQRYQVKKEIGKGRYGTVYLAHDSALEREIALKILDNHFLFHPSVTEKFFSEARIAARLNHRHIISIYDVGELSGSRFISMEYVDGETLEKHFNRSERFSYSKAREILLQLCEALEYAHRQGVIHGNLHPNNIFVARDGIMKISDFSLYASLNETLLTLSGAVFHENLYASPEEIIGAEIDEKSDMYSFGLIAYQMLAGELPFKNNASDCKLSGFTLAEGNINRELKDMLSICLQRQPDQRYSCFEELRKQLVQSEHIVSQAD